MAFPTIPTTAAGRVVTGIQANTTATRTFPALSGLTKNSGDLLIAIIFAYQGGTTAAATWSGWSAGWTEVVDSGSSATNSIGIAYKWSDGTESAAITVTQAATITGHVTMMLLSIPGAHATSPPEVSNNATGTTAAADPPNHTPTWGADDTLWIPVAAVGRTATSGTFTGVTAAPTNYSNFAATASSGGGIIGDTMGGVAFRQLNAASENVGPFTVDTSNARNMALVVAVRPVAANAFNANPSDSTSLSDSVATELGRTVTPGDSATTSDAQAFDFGEGLADSSASSDALAFAVGEAVADSSAPSDLTDQSIGKFVTPGDSVTPTDGTIQETGKSVSPADSTTPTDAQAFGFGPAAADSSAPTDAQAFGVGEGLSDSASAGDAASATRGLAVLPADTATSSDAQTFGFGPSTADATSISDALAFAYGSGLADSTAVSDAAQVARGIDAQVADATAIGDSVSVVKFFMQAVDDATALSDALQTAQGYNLSNSDSTALSDALVAAQGYARTLSDTLITSDLVYFDRSAAITDVVTLADQQSKGVGSGVAEAVVVVDSATPSRALAALLDDALAATDSVVTFVPGSGAPYVHTEMPQGGVQLSGQAQSGTTVLLVLDGNVAVYEASGISLPYDAEGDSE